MKKWIVMGCCCGLLLASLSACGRRGPLEAASSSVATERDAGLFGPGGTDASGLDNPAAPDRSFLLDPLI